MTSLVVLLVLLAGALAWFLVRPKGPGRVDPNRTHTDGIDDEVLAAAEDEVQGVDPFAAPGEAEEELPDWGPGTPKP